MSKDAKEVREVHKCPLGVVINPFWIKIFCATLGGAGMLIAWGSSMAYNSYASVTSSVAAHQVVIDQVVKANLPDRMIRIEVQQQTAHEAQERMETKLDRLFEVWHQPNPAPKPDHTP